MTDAPELSALDQAQAELSAAMVPWPDDYVETLSPQAVLLLLRQMSMAAMKVVAGAVISLDEEPSESAGVVDEIVNGVAACIAGSTHALVALEVLPPEAEQALEAEAT